MIESHIQAKLANKHRLNLKNYKKLDRINSGGYGTVFKVQEIKTKQLYAAKVLQRYGREEEYKNMVNREISIMIRVQHPTLVKFYGYSLTDIYGEPNATIIIEYSENGSLSEYITESLKGRSSPKYNNTNRQIILIGIARGMMYLHEHHVVHRDLKPGNVLLDSEFRPHIIDFGCSKYYDPKKDPSTDFNGGTVYYMAPESISENTYNEKTDVFAFGMLMYEVVADKQLYSKYRNLNPIQFLTQFHEKKIPRPKFNFQLKKSIQVLIERCWSEDPNKRPTFEELFHKLAHCSEEWIIDVYEEKETENDYDVFNYFLDDVDANEVFKYVEEISEKTHKEHIEQLENKVEQLEYEIKILKEKVTPIESLTKQIEQLKQQISTINQPKSEIKKKIKKTSRSMKSKSDFYPFEISDFVIVKQIGIESFCKTFKVQNKKSKKYYTAKILNEKIDESKLLIKEFFCLTNIANPALIKYEGFSPIDFDKKNYPVVLMEYLGNLSLKECLSNKPKEWNKTKMIINIIGISFGMKCLHDDGIIHCYLRPANILLDSKLYPKIMNYHIFKLINENDENNIDNDFIYEAPEFSQNDSYNNKVDVYSFAMILYEFFTSKPPVIKGNSKFMIYTNASKGMRPDLKKVSDGPIKELIQKCWSPNPDDRPTFDEIIHCFTAKRNDFWPSDVDVSEVEKYIKKFDNTNFKKHTIDDDDDYS